MESVPLYRNQSGFTIVELLIVIVVIAILATISIVAYSGVQQRAHAASLQADLHNAAKQLAVDKALNGGTFPATLSQVNNGQGLKASIGTTYTYYYDTSVTPATYCLTATNSSLSYNVTETSAPAQGACPSVLATVISSTEVDLRWFAPDGVDVNHYRVQRDAGITIGTTFATSYNDTTVTSGARKYNIYASTNPNGTEVLVGKVNVTVP